jgi:CheY-like chemotaxis protein/nitrogen-specific signal transduction histidine kinase
MNKFIIVAIIFSLISIFIAIYFTEIIEKIFFVYDSQIRKEKERAEKAAKVKSEFLANMSHEIRTPLNAMFGFIKILEEKELDEESKKYLRIIERSGENLLTIINDILDFSKLESGKFKIEMIEFNPKEEFEIIHQLFAGQASEKNILLEFKEINLNYNIISDPTRIKQVVANLLSNAIKFTPENRKVILKVEYNMDEELLNVEVRDEGIGIPKEKLEHIFEAFSQADNSTTRKYGGTGLGLTISYRLIGLLGGELRVESEVGKGSRFYFSIPAKKGSKIDETLKKEPAQKRFKDDEKFDFSVLLVEDNKANQMFMKVILNKFGIEFDIANDGVEAVELYKNNFGKYDLILMDENMPNMNGIEATKQIRNFEKEQGLDKIPIVALTANALEGDKERFIIAGMNYYLSKPLEIEKFKEILILIKERK